MYKHHVRMLVGIFLFMPMVYLNAAVFKVPPKGTDIVGKSFTIEVSKGDTIDSIAKHYGVGYHELIEANPTLNPQYLHVGQSILIPGVFILPKYREGVVVNTAEARLFYFKKNAKKVYTYPVGLGRKNWRTPITKTYIKNKKESPYWYPTKNIRQNVLEATGKKMPKVVPPGPHNPLGRFVIYLGIPTYLIHATDKPGSVGKYLGAGCVRMYKSDMAELYKMVRKNETVRIIHHPYKLGYRHGDLYLEAHKPVSNEKPESRLNRTDVDQVIQSAQHSEHAHVKTGKLRRVIRAHHGLPVAIGKEEHR